MDLISAMSMGPSILSRESSGGLCVLLSVGISAEVEGINTSPK